MENIIYQLNNMKQLLETDREYNHLIEIIDEIIYQLKYEI